MWRTTAGLSYAGMKRSLTHRKQADRNEQLPCIIQGEVCDPQAEFPFLSEGVENQNDVTDQKQKGTRRKDRMKQGTFRNQISDGYAVEQNHRTDVDDAEDPECFFCGDL